MNIVERGKRAKRQFMTYAVLNAVCACYTVALGSGPTWWRVLLAVWCTAGACWFAYRWREVRDALNHPLIYLVALQDEFGGMS